jgi:hypothetical protein
MSLFNGLGRLMEMTTAFGIISAFSFGLLLPFLLLAFANASYRERLKELLRLAGPAPPSAPQPPASPFGPGGAEAPPAVQPNVAL